MESRLSAASTPSGFSVAVHSTSHGLIVRVPDISYLVLHVRAEFVCTALDFCQAFGRAPDPDFVSRPNLISLLIRLRDLYVDRLR